MNTVQVDEPGYSEAINVIGKPWLLSVASDQPFVAELQMFAGGRWHYVYDGGKLLTLSDTGPSCAYAQPGLKYRLSVRECTAPVTMTGTELSAFSVCC